jgi:hypothetical protein
LECSILVIPGYAASRGPGIQQPSLDSGFALRAPRYDVRCGRTRTK